MPTDTTSRASSRGPATTLAIAHKSTLKPDHQSLLDSLLADEGMASATLETLVEHLFEEEDPRLIEALHRARVGVPVDVVSEASRRPGTTVGNLRQDRAPASTGGGSVGSLRKR